MVSTLLKVPRYDGEELENYIRKRARSARGVWAQKRMWSLGWFRRVLQRPRNGDTWAAILRNWQGTEWLMEQRIAHTPMPGYSASVFAGQTATRSYHGKVCIRWHDGIDYVRACS